MNSVIVEPGKNGVLPIAAQEIVLWLASVADDIPPWGVSPGTRDRKLREFWTTEPILASSIYTIVAKYAAFGWSLTGPPKTVSLTQRLINGFEHGQGWGSLMSKTLIDYFTQDNGAFMEFVRTEDRPTAPVIGVNHLDSNRCERTGRRDEPVIYWDAKNNAHIMKWYHVASLTELPSPIESAYGRQYCAVTRLLRDAQTRRDISVYKREKVSGRFNRGIYLVSGVQNKTIQDVLTVQRNEAEQAGMTRYMHPPVIAALDPNATVKVESIQFASLPDGFDEEVSMKWYITLLALAFGCDYQDFAPLPGGNLGSSQQSQTLHLKARGKGPRLFMSAIENMFNFHGVLPGTVHFQFGDQDIVEDTSKAQLKLIRAKERATRIASGEITVELARQLAADDGDLDMRYLQAMGEPNITEEATVGSNADSSAVPSADGKGTGHSLPGTGEGSQAVLPKVGNQGNQQDEKVSTKTSH